MKYKIALGPYQVRCIKHVNDNSMSLITIKQVIRSMLIISGHHGIKATGCPDLE